MSVQGQKYQNGKLPKIKEENAYNSDPMGFTWSSNWSDLMQKYWDKIPNSVGTLIASIAVFILGSTIRAEWLHILVHFLRAFYKTELETSRLNSTEQVFFGINLDRYYMKDLPFFLIVATTISYLFYFGIGGFLHWHYYIRRRDCPEEWKCQPHKWLPPNLERHEIMLGTLSLTIGSVLSSVLSCYVLNGGWTTIYYDISDHGWLWFFASIPITFVYQDYLTYWHHRLYHTPFLYKKFHKLHHTYKQPTAFSVTAIHPVEFVHIQSILISPMFLFPVHWSIFVSLMMYLYYHGILDHSGINFKSYWWQPWQPDCIFHDNHHQYFHVNFGFNCSLWDTIHGTYRQKDKVYNEDIYFGKGKSIEECSKEELNVDLEERESENHLAYRGADKDEQVKELKSRMTEKSK